MITALVILLMGLFNNQASLNSQATMSSVNIVLFAALLMAISQDIGIIKFLWREK